MMIVSLVLILWFVIGAVAAGQGGCLGNADGSCTGVGTTGVTVLAGPLNYVGVNPEVNHCALPQASPSPSLVSGGCRDRPRCCGAVRDGG